MSTTRRVAVGLGAALVLLAIPVPARANRPLPAWELVEVTAGSTALASLDVGQEGQVVPDGQGELVLGLGVTQPGFAPALLAVAYASRGTQHLTTTRGLGGLSVQAAPGDASELPFSSHLYVQGLAPGATARLLVFFGHARMRLAPLDTEGVPAGTRVRRVLGRGLTTLDYVQPDEDGVGAGAGPVAVSATVSRTVRSREGLVGAFVLPGLLFDGTPTVGSWRGPSGHGTFVAAPGLLQQAPFAGPPGSWSWSWQGAGHGYAAAPTALVYLPLGALWQAFKGVA